MPRPREEGERRERARKGGGLSLRRLEGIWNERLSTERRWEARWVR